MSHSVHADTIARVSRAARELGADLSRSGSPSPERASSRELYATWERAFERCGEAVVDRVARGITLDELGVFGFATLTAPTTLQSIEAAARNYAWITCDGRWRVEHDTDEVMVRFERAPAATLGRRVSDESALAQFLACMQQATEVPVVVKRVTTRVAPLAPSTFERLAGRRPERGESDAITLDRASLSRPCVRAHEGMHGYFCHQMESLVANLQVSSWTQSVRSAIRYALEAEALCGEGVAQVLGVSFRTMQRRLRSEGSNFRALCEELRAAHARALLERGLRVEDAARRAGYADSSAFHRAFRRWQESHPAPSRDASASRVSDERTERHAGAGQVTRRARESRGCDQARAVLLAPRCKRSSASASRASSSPPRRTAWPRSPRSLGKRPSLASAEQRNLARIGSVPLRSRAPVARCHCSSR